jgi:uncharacterized membrane protein
MKKIDIKEARKIIKESKGYLDLLLKMNFFSLIKLIKTSYSFIQKRFKSYIFWASVASFIYVALESFGLINLTPTNYESIANAILGVLILYGVISDPTKEEVGKTIVETDGDMIFVKNIDPPKKNKGKSGAINRLKNYALWISVASLVALLVPKIFNINIDLGEWKIFVDSMLSIFVIFGIINNPTTENKGFGDDQF